MKFKFVNSEVLLRSFLKYIQLQFFDRNKAQMENYSQNSSKLSKQVNQVSNVVKQTNNPPNCQNQRIGNSFHRSSEDKTLSTKQIGKDKEAINSKIKLAKVLTKIHRSKLFRLFLLVMLILFLIGCIFEGSNSDALNDSAQLIIKISVALFWLSFVIQITNWKSESFFWIFLNLITNSCGIAIIFVNDAQLLRYLKAIRTLKIVNLFKIVQCLGKCMRTFIISWKKVAKVLAPFLIFTYFYALTGLYCFKDLQYQKCRDPSNKYKQSNWTIYSEQIFICSQTYPCPEKNGLQLECLNPIDYGVEPNEKELKNFTQAMGYLSFRNIFSALISTIKQIFVTGSSKLINLYKHTLQKQIVSIFFFCFILFIPYIYFNIFYGLLISIEDQSEETQVPQIQQQSSEKSGKTKKNMRIETNNTLFQVSQMTLSKKEQVNNSVYLKQKIPEKSQQKIIITKKGSKVFQEKKEKYIENIFEHAEQVPEINQQDKSQINSQTYSNLLNIKACFEKIFRPLLVLLSIINLSICFQGQSEQLTLITGIIHFVFLILYLIEVILVFLCEKLINKEVSKTLTIDFIILLTCFTGMIYDGAVSSSFEQFVRPNEKALVSKILHCIIYLRIFLVVSGDIFFLKDPQQIIFCIFQSVVKIRYFIGIWFITVFILSMMSFYLHQTDSNATQKDRLTFKTIQNSIVFTTLTIYDQEWDYLVYTKYEQFENRIMIWQLSVMIVGYIMFSKYLMCLLAKQIDKLFSNIQILKNQSLQSPPISVLEQNTNNQLVLPLSKEKVSENMQQDGFRVCLNKFKTFFLFILQSKVFEIVKIVFICITAVMISLTHPQAKRDSEQFQVIRKINIICIVFFCFEQIGNFFINGICSRHQDWILKSFYFINMALVIIELASFTPIQSEYVYYRIQKVRCLRVLTLLQMRFMHDWDMRVLLRSMTRLILSSVKLFYYLAIIYFFFAIILTKLYKDDFYYCHQPYSSETIQTKDDCLNWGGDWLRYDFNFSTPLESLRFTFIIGTMEGWLYLMNAAMDMNEKNMAPSFNSNYYVQFLFLVIFFVCNLIVLNSFISLSFTFYKKIKEEQSGQVFLTKEEKTWLLVKQQLGKIIPVKQKKEPENVIGRYAFNFLRDKSFKILKLLIMLAFVIYLSTQKTSTDQSLLDETIAWGIIVLVIITSNILTVLSDGLQFSPTSIIEKVFCVYSIVFYFIWLAIQLDKKTRIYLAFFFISGYLLTRLQLLQEIPFLRRMFNSFYSILPQMSNLLLLAILVLYIYGIIGMELFSFLKFDTELDQYNQNYTNFSFALFSLAKFSIMESPIEQIVQASQTLNPKFICFDIQNYEDFQKYGQNGCGNPISSNFFFLNFHMVYTLMIMPTFFGFIANAYSEVRKQQSCLVTQFFLKKIVILWSKDDPEASGFVQCGKFWIFYKKLIDLYESHREEDYSHLERFSRAKTFLSNLKLSIYEENGQFYFEFHEFIESFAKIYLQEKFNEKYNEDKINRILKKQASYQRSLSKKKTKFSSLNVNCLNLLKLGLKSWKKKLKKKREYIIPEELGQIE